MPAYYRTMNAKTQAALIGGVAIGLLSAIPFVNLVNMCCCAWAIAGGLLATYLYVQKSPTPVRPGDGAVIGLMAGAIGAVIYVILGVPLSLAAGSTVAAVVAQLVERIDPAQAEQLRVQLEQQGQNVAAAILGGLFGGVVLVIFATLGGLLGVPLFEKRKNGVPPMSPPASPIPGAGTQPGTGYRAGM